MTYRHKVFVSYHHANDQGYREKFEKLCTDRNDIMLSMSVQDGDIDPYLRPETIRQKIRDQYLRDSTVTVVLVGSQTWQRKHVDWEIGSSIRHTQYNSRSGLLGILLPTYPLVNGQYNPRTIPPRLYDNVKNGYAELYHWTTDASAIQRWIHQAFLRRNTHQPDNSYQTFVNNRSGGGWT